MTLKEAKDFTAWIGGWMLLLWILMELYSATPLGRDSTDPHSWGFRTRSGMGLHEDARTGCEYLVASGGITPRLDRDGSHYGCRALVKP